MITLKFASYSSTVEQLEESLKSLSLAFRLEVDDSIEEPILKDGDLSVTGEKAIQAHLEKLSGELKQWWYCDC